MTAQTGVLATLGRGHHDDGGEGNLLTRLDQAGLAAVPLFSLRGTTEAATGTSTSTLSITASSYYPNTGVPGAAQLTAASSAAETAQNGAYLQARFFGRRAGVWLVGLHEYDPTMTVLVNRELVYSGKVGTRMDGYLIPAANGINDGNLIIPCAQDLADDGPHTMIVYLNPDPAGAMSIIPHALMLEERVGYRTDQRLFAQVQQYVVTLTGSAQSINQSSRVATLGIHFINQDTVARVVTLSDTANGQLAAKSVGAGEDWTWLPASGQPVAWQNTLQAKVDAAGAGVVKAIPIEAV